ncbi:N-acetylmuramoyl-L-alanine amidase [Streptomyces scabiei]|uniref:N-acetylmuramoyl-L-alanine amidase n=1 Tax=Streptomyces scabiei TaxID=1930 RepID=A0A100JY39_STRSC|nr:N-acetylmuramoyl-L-alanine amidase [Streptomyces scabiei]
MRVFRMSRGARIRRLRRAWRRRTRTPRAPGPLHRRSRPTRDRVRLAWEHADPPRRVLLVLLACLPGLAAVLVVVLLAVGADRPGHRAGRPAARPVPPHQAPMPPIVPRTRWLEKEAPSQPPARYDDEVAAVFIHHTDSPNGYDCADAPRIIRYLYAGQTGAKDWDDIGYNFLVDRCGTIYEGRAGGITRAVTGAHTQGFNHRTTGIAALGTFTAGVPVPRAMTDAIAALAAWKLGLSDTDPRGSVRLTSSNSLSRYPSGTTVLMPTLAGHSDGYMTSCPGAALAERLPAIRELAAHLQGRR